MSDTPRVVVYTRAWCGYCTAAIGLLKAQNIPHEQIDLSGDHRAMAELKARSGHSTMPQVFVDDTLVGGFNELDRYVRSHGADALR